MAESGTSAPQSQRASPNEEPQGEGKGDGDGVGQHDFANPTLSIIGNASRSPSYSGTTSLSPSREGTPPPLPPRPQLATTGGSLLSPRPASSHSVKRMPSRPQLMSKATTQLSITNTQAYGNDARDDADSPASSKPRHVLPTPTHTLSSSATSDADDSASVKSDVPTVSDGAGESILGEVLGAGEKSQLEEQTLLRSLGHRFADSEALSLFPPDPDLEAAFDSEFDDVADMAADASNQDHIMRQWRAKLKHFLILSSAGKPIFSRHGDDQLITNYIGVVQTLISFYQSTKDGLRSFTAGDVRFVVMSKGPLNLLAITRLPESDAQLRAQLDALYMQILSTLTLPSLERMFAARANYDLRRPLQGTETLLSALADGFTRGSPSTLLSALECLKLRKSHRNTINNTLLKTRSENLLYGLIVASGRLVSVIRPSKHSLHPGDLHLIFNMLFEAGSVKAGGGENWIPLCLPGFNKTGYLYMYVSFLNLENPSEQMQERPRTRDGAEDEVAVLLISADKESFFEMRKARDDLVKALTTNKSITHISAAVHAGRPSCTDIVPGSPLRHFLYKSRGNVQFTMPSYVPYFPTALDRRRLLSLYAQLHADLHKRPATLKIHHQTSSSAIALAWSTPLFELYAVAPPNTSRQALAQAAMKVVQWVRREEERVFIIGGAVF